MSPGNGRSGPAKARSTAHQTREDLRSNVPEGTDRRLVPHAIAVLPAGLQQAIQHAESDWFFTGAMTAIQQLAETGRGFTVDNVIDLVGEPSDPHYLGAVFAAAQKRKIIESVGCRVSADNRLVRIWWKVRT